jgi:carotenoid 9,10(9',10')-cleavage dioxygenase 1
VIARASSRAGPPPSTAIPPSTDHTPVKNLTSSAKQQNDSFDTACDLKAGTVLQDADYGEHAAAFLSGNFQPVIEEVTASVLLSGEDARGFEASNQTFYILGEIPADFPAGKFAYVGPNPKFSLDHYKIWGRGPNQSNSGGADGWHHWFEGDGMIYALDFGGANTHLWQKGSRKEAVYNSQGGGDKQKSFHAKERGASRNVCYRNRYVRTNSWKKEMRHGGRLFRPLMNASGSAFLPNAVANFLLGGSFLKDSANTALCHFTGRLFALQDTMPPWELNNDTLETVGICDFDGTLPFYVPFTAHPKVAPGTGDLLFFGFNPVYPPHCSIGSVSPEGSVGPIKALWHNALRGATFIHDFCVTENYTVIFEGSMNIRPMRMLKGVHPLQYDRSQLARFGVIRRRSDGTMSDVTWCVCAEPEMVYHFVNAWEDSLTGEIVIVGVREDGFFHGALAATGTRNWITNTLQEGKSVPRLHEWRIDPSSGRILSERWLFDDVIEIPRINDKFTGLQNRYAYAGRIHTASLSRDAQLKFDAVVKFDLVTGAKEVYEHGAGRYGMEAQFVPRFHPCTATSAERVLDPGATSGNQTSTEDDGWLVLFVHDESDASINPAERCSECIILDAKRIQDGPVARIRLPSRIPYGAHAVWCPVSSKTNTQTSPLQSVDQQPRSKSLTDQMLTSPPKPRMFAVSPGQHKALLGGVVTGILRAASGLFVHGWRPSLTFDDPEEYAFVRMLGLRLKEVHSLGMIRRRQLDEESRSGHIVGDIFKGTNSTLEDSLPFLTLFEQEGCGECRRVREAISILDMPCMLRPCPQGAIRNRSEAAAAQMESHVGNEDKGDHFSIGDAELPYLEDRRTGAKLTGADHIIHYLFGEYLDGARPPEMITQAAKAFAQIAVDARGAQDGSAPADAFYSRPSRVAGRPLQLWAYEASPFCALVRETLSELEISYVLQPCARGSPRRTQLMQRTGGTFQVPYLEDPNTGVAIFESAAIIEYLRSRYAVD